MPKRAPPDPCGWMHADSPAHAPRRPLLPARPLPRHSPPAHHLHQPSDFGWLPGVPPRMPRDDGSAPHLAALAALGLDGLIDAHTHWFPDNVNAKIWQYFDRHYWPIAYRGSTERRLEWIRRNGVRRFATLAYAHRPAMAEWLNGWTMEFCARVSEAIPCATFYPEPDAAAYVRRAIEQHGVRAFKIHLRVGDFDPGAAELEPVFEQIAAAGLPVVVHAGSAPDPGRFTAPEVLGRVLARHPRLRVIIAHLGASEFEHYLALAESRATVALDTTMVFTGFTACDPYPEHFVARLEAISEQVLFGSDFPTIPYPLSHAVQSFLALPFTDEAKRRMLRDNALRWFGVSAP